MPRTKELSSTKQPPQTHTFRFPDKGDKWGWSETVEGLQKEGGKPDSPPM